jgi:hypothetical protein
MKAISCCGMRRKDGLPPDVRPLPSNPSVTTGRQIIYLGGSHLQLKAVSGLSYYFGPERRYAAVAPEDLATFLSRADFMLKPSRP